MNAPPFPTSRYFDLAVHETGHLLASRLIGTEIKALIADGNGDVIEVRRAASNPRVPDGVADAVIMVSGFAATELLKIDSARGNAIARHDRASFLELVGGDCELADASFAVMAARMLEALTPHGQVIVQAASVISTLQVPPGRIAWDDSRLAPLREVVERVGVLEDLP